LGFLDLATKATTILAWHAYDVLFAAAGTSMTVADMFSDGEEINEVSRRYNQLAD
jgi:aldehyde:ferredoxin oxidoreductase